MEQHQQQHSPVLYRQRRHFSDCGITNHCPTIATNANRESLRKHGEGQDERVQSTEKKPSSPSNNESMINSHLIPTEVTWRTTSRCKSITTEESTDDCIDQSSCGPKQTKSAKQSLNGYHRYRRYSMESGIRPDFSSKTMEATPPPPPPPPPPLPYQYQQLRLHQEIHHSRG